jgi:hypothetical protein
MIPATGLSFLWTIPSMLTTPLVRKAVTSSASPGVTFTECPVDSPAADDVRATA